MSEAPKPQSRSEDEDSLARALKRQGAGGPRQTGAKTQHSLDVPPPLPTTKSQESAPLIIGCAVIFVLLLVMAVAVTLVFNQKGGKKGRVADTAASMREERVRPTDSKPSPSAPTSPPYVAVPAGYAGKDLPAGWSYYNAAGWKVASPFGIRLAKGKSEIYETSLRGLTVMCSRSEFRGPLVKPERYLELFAENYLDATGSKILGGTVSGMRSESRTVAGWPAAFAQAKATVKGEPVAMSLLAVKNGDELCLLGVTRMGEKLTGFPANVETLIYTHSTLSSPASGGNAPLRTSESPSPDAVPEGWGVYEVGDMEVSSPIALRRSETSNAGLKILEAKSPQYEVAAACSSLPLGTSVEKASTQLIQIHASRTLKAELQATNTLPVTFLGRAGAETTAEAEVDGEVQFIRSRVADVNGLLYHVCTVVAKDNTSGRETMEKVLDLARLREGEKLTTAPRVMPAPYTVRPLPADWKLSTVDDLQVAAPFSLEVGEEKGDVTAIKGSSSEIIVLGSVTQRTGANVNLTFRSETALMEVEEGFKASATILNQKDITFLGLPGRELTAEIELNKSPVNVQIRTTANEKKIYQIITVAAKNLPRKVAEEVFLCSRLTDGEPALAATPGWNTFTARDLRLEAPVTLKALSVEDAMEGSDLSFAGFGDSLAVSGVVAPRAVWVGSKLENASRLLESMAEGMKGKITVQKSTEIKYLGLPAVEITAEIVSKRGTWYVKLRFAEAADDFYGIILLSLGKPKEFNETAKKIFASARLIKPDAGEWETYDVGRLRVKSPFPLKREEYLREELTYLGLQGITAVVASQQENLEPDRKLGDLTEKALATIVRSAEGELGKRESRPAEFLGGMGMESTADAMLGDRKIKLTVRAIADKKNIYMLLLMVPATEVGREFTAEVFSAVRLAEE